MGRIAGLLVALALVACAESHPGCPVPDMGPLAGDAGPELDAGWCGADGDYCDDGDLNTTHDQCWAGECGGCIQGAQCTVTTYEGTWSYTGDDERFPLCVQRDAPEGTPCVTDGGEQGRCNDRRQCL